MSFNELSQALWRQRSLLELLVFKLETIQALVATGHTRWVPRATREMESVSEEMRLNNVALVAASEAAARSLGLPEQTGLRALAEAAPQPWCELLTEHYSAYVSLTEQVQQAAATNTDLLTRHDRHVTEQIANAAQDQVRTYDPTGRATATQAPIAPMLIDQAL